MAKDVFFENGTGPIIDDLLEKYKLKESPDQAFKKMSEGKYFNGGVILNAAKSVVMDELNTTTLPSYLKEQMQISDTEADNLSKDILEKLVSEAEVGDVPEEAEPIESEKPKQNIQIEEADRMPVMPTAEPLPASEMPSTAPQMPQSTPVAVPAEIKPAPVRKITLPKESPVASESAGPEPKVKMKRGPDAYRESIE
jgi:hypothetical protein